MFLCSPNTSVDVENRENHFSQTAILSLKLSSLNLERKDREMVISK